MEKLSTDIQFKDALRKELMMYEDYLELLENGETYHKML